MDSIPCMKARRSSVSACMSCAALFGAFALAACEDDGDLWGDAMSPTQVQRADRGPGPSPTYFATTQGDSDDPFVDNPNYPFVEEPWWQNPAYDGG